MRCRARAARRRAQRRSCRLSTRRAYQVATQLGIAGRGRSTRGATRRSPWRTHADPADARVVGRRRSTCPTSTARRTRCSSRSTGSTDTAFGPLGAGRGVDERRCRFRRRRARPPWPLCSPRVAVDDLRGSQPVAQARLRSSVLRPLLGTHERRDQDGDQNGNDQDHHHELDEREPCFGLVLASHGVRMLHTAPLVWRCARSQREEHAAPDGMTRTQAIPIEDRSGPGTSLPGPLGSRVGSAYQPVQRRDGRRRRRAGTLVVVRARAAHRSRRRRSRTSSPTSTRSARHTTLLSTGNHVADASTCRCRRATSTSATARSRRAVAVVAVYTCVSVYDVFSAVNALRRSDFAAASCARSTRTEELRDGDRDQNGNDQHDHHQLDEGEAFLAVPTPSNERTNLIALGWPLSGFSVSGPLVAAPRRCGISTVTN